VPIYEYRCEKCGNEYEKREGFEAPPRQRCPQCRGRALRVLQAAPIVFKGSGFYVTDNRKSGAPSGSSESTPSETTPAKSDSSPDKSTESAAAS
jgi:putative FmdB family regulatory protein